TAGVMTALMRNGRDRRLGEPVMGHAILERVLLFGTRSADYIRASGHNGCIATEVTLQATTEAEYMTAPARFADSQIPLAPRAPSIHDPSQAVAVEGHSHRERPARYFAQLRSQGRHGGDGEVRGPHQGTRREPSRLGGTGRTAACRPAGTSRAVRHPASPPA